MAMGCRILPGGKLSQSVVPLWKVIVGNLSTKLRRAQLARRFSFVFVGPRLVRRFSFVFPGALWLGGFSFWF
jgi:hypothetical protein